MFLDACTRKLQLYPYSKCFTNGNIMVITVQLYISKQATTTIEIVVFHVMSRVILSSCTFIWAASDDDECSRLRPCSDFCHNSMGSFYCSCPPGFTLDVDGRQCTGKSWVQSSRGICYGNIAETCIAVLSLLLQQLVLNNIQSTPLFSYRHTVSINWAPTVHSLFHLKIDHCGRRAQTKPEGVI